MESILLVEPPRSDRTAGWLNEAGYDVTRATSLEAALGLLSAEAYDLVLLGERLQEADTFALLEAVRHLPKDERPGPVVASRRADVDHRARCLDAGAEDYLAQPFERQDVARVGTVLRLRALRSERRLHTGEVTSQRARLFELVEAAKREWERTVDALADAIAVIDGSGCVVRANRAFAELVAVPVEELRGQVFEELVASACRELEGVAAARRFCRDLPDGDLRVIEETVAIRHPEEGGGSIRTLRDVTDRLQYEEACRQLAEADRLASIGRLAAGLAHQINNPLAYVISNVAELDGSIDDVFRALSAGDEREASSAQREVGAMLADVHEGLSRIRTIVAQMAPFSAMEYERAEVIDVNGSVTEAIDRMLHEHPIAAEPQFQAGPTPAVAAYPRQLAEAILHVLRNAVLATGDQAEAVRVRTYSHAGRVFIEVSDDGPGIPVSERVRVFEPFFTTWGDTQSAGLGLSVARTVLRRHGGTIDVDESPSGGARVRLALPVSPGAVVLGTGPI